ncbi:MAG: hypothetical protein SOW50_03130, partial [Lachnospiraceae bacterium]|nr:hypothetical protein [Lachnospiraceae bacterium]
GAITKTKSGFDNLSLRLTNLKEGFMIAKATGGQFGARASKLGAALGSITAPMVAVAAVVGALIAALVTLWKTNDEFRQNITNTWNEIKEKVSGFCDGIVERINALGFDFENITEVLKAIWMGFCDLVAPIFEGAFSAVSTILGTVLDVITGIFDVFIGLFTLNWEQAWNGVKEIFGGVLNGITGIFGIAIDIIRGIADAICGWFGTTWKDTWQSVKDFFANIWNNISSFFENIGTNISTAFHNFIDTIVTFFSNLPYNIGYLLGVAIGHVIQFVIDLGTHAIEAGRTFVDNLINFIKTAPGKIAEWLANTIAKVASWAVDFKNRAKQAGSDFVDKVISTIKNLPGNLREWLLSTTKKVIEWGPELLRKGKDAISQLKDGIIDGAKSLPDRMKEIGKNIVDGVWKGIVKAKNKFVSDVKGFFSGIVDGVKDTLKIHSPSQVFEKEIGWWLPLGAAVGFKNAMPQAVKDMQSSLDKGISKLTVSDATVNTAFSVESFADKVKKIYNEVAIWFANIDVSLRKSIDGMSQNLQELLEAGKSVVDVRDDFGDVVLKKYTSRKVDVRDGTDDDNQPLSGNGNTYVFYSNTSLSATECKREMEKAQEEMAFGI